MLIIILPATPIPPPTIFTCRPGETLAVPIPTFPSLVITTLSDPLVANPIVFAAGA